MNIPVEIILIGSTEVYSNFLSFGFSGSWRYDAYCDDYLKTFFEVTGIPVHLYSDGHIISVKDLNSISWSTNCVADASRLTDMYRLKEWLRLVLLHGVNLAVL
jgi:hypothetical protein